MISLLTILGLLLNFSSGLDLQNNYFKIIKDELVNSGGSSNFTVELLKISEDIVTCNVETPDGEIWEVTDGQVLDDGGQPVIGYQALDNGNPTKICGIKIESVASMRTDLGKQLIYN